MPSVFEIDDQLAVALTGRSAAPGFQPVGSLDTRKLQKRPTIIERDIELTRYLAEIVVGRKADIVAAEGSCRTQILQGVRSQSGRRKGTVRADGAAPPGKA